MHLLAILYSLLITVSINRTGAIPADNEADQRQPIVVESGTFNKPQNILQSLMTQNEKSKDEVDALLAKVPVLIQTPGYEVDKTLKLPAANNQLVPAANSNSPVITSELSSKPSLAVDARKSDISQHAIAAKPDISIQTPSIVCQTPRVLAKSLEIVIAKIPKNVQVRPSGVAEKSETSDPVANKKEVHVVPVTNLSVDASLILDKQGPGTLDAPSSLVKTENIVSNQDIVILIAERNKPIISLNTAIPKPKKASKKIHSNGAARPRRDDIELDVLSELYKRDFAYAGDDMRLVNEQNVDHDDLLVQDYDEEEIDEIEHDDENELLDGPLDHKSVANNIVSGVADNERINDDAKIENGTVTETTNNTTNSNIDTNEITNVNEDDDKGDDLLVSDYDGESNDTEGDVLSNDYDFKNPETDIDELENVDDENDDDSMEITRIKRTYAVRKGGKREKGQKGKKRSSKKRKGRRQSPNRAGDKQKLRSRKGKKNRTEQRITSSTKKNRTRKRKTKITDNCRSTHPYGGLARVYWTYKNQRLRYLSGASLMKDGQFTILPITFMAPNENPYYSIEMTFQKKMELKGLVLEKETNIETAWFQLKVNGRWTDLEVTKSNGGSFKKVMDMKGNMFEYDKVHVINGLRIFPMKTSGMTRFRMPIPMECSKREAKIENKSTLVKENNRMKFKSLKKSTGLRKVMRSKKNKKSKTRKKYRKNQNSRKVNRGMNRKSRKQRKGRKN